MNNKDFGEFVKALRNRNVFNAGQELKFWTQAHLARRASEVSGQIITTAKIAAIEQGKVKDVVPYLKPLSQAFELNEAEKEYFYAVAGLIYRNEREPDSKEITDLFRSIEFPGFARTPLWDFIAFNKHNCVLWGYTAELLDRLREPPLGPNVLKVLFDPAFRSMKYKGGETLWRADAKRSIEAFRFESFRYVNTARFREILDAMNKYHEFTTHWNNNDRSPIEKISNPTRPVARVYHPKYRMMEFLSLRTPSKYLGSAVDISIYVPLSSSVDRYRNLREDAKFRDDLQDVYTFDEVHPQKRNRRRN